MKLTKTFFVALGVSLCTTLFAQDYTVAKSSTAKIIGTSTLHDWESDVEDISGSATLEFDGTTLKSIPSMELKFAVESIESGKSKMNSITYETLKSKSNPHIIYKVKSVKSVEGDQVTVSGDLTIAGQTKTTDMTGKLVNKGSSVQITAKKKIDMTQFGIEPPTAMLGTIVVGKDIDLDFNITLTKK